MNRAGRILDDAACDFTIERKRAQRLTPRLRGSLQGAKYPTPESRLRQREALIELYRKGKIAEALRAFKKVYLEVVDQLIDHLKSQESDSALVD